jgi:predicted Zn-dependent protease
MKLVALCTAMIGFSISRFIEINWEKRPVYISKLIGDEHMESIYDAMSQLGLVETEDKSINHIRIEYAQVNGGKIEMLASTNSDGFYIYDTVIGMNRLLDEVMFQCVVLHELCHALGLAHTEDGVMAAVIQQTDEKCFISFDNMVNLYLLYT